jgi:hypothetical protein
MAWVWYGYGYDIGIIGNVGRNISVVNVKVNYFTC